MECRRTETVKLTRYLPKGVTTSAVALTLLLSSCVVFVGPYDEVTDKAITDLQVKTEQFLAKMEVTGGSYSENRNFYEEAKGSIRSIELRAALYEKNEGELKALKLLEENLDNLAELHQAGPLKGRALTAARSSLETNFQSLIQIELAKKRSSGVSAPKST
jgi:hypothetical protein